MAAHASAPDRLTRCQVPSGSGIYIPGAPVPAAVVCVLCSRSCCAEDTALPGLRARLTPHADFLKFKCASPESDSIPYDSARAGVPARSPQKAPLHRAVPCAKFDEGGLSGQGCRGSLCSVATSPQTQR